MRLPGLHSSGLCHLGLNALGVRRTDSFLTNLRPADLRLSGLPVSYLGYCQNRSVITARLADLRAADLRLSGLPLSSLRLAGM